MTSVPILRNKQARSFFFCKVQFPILLWLRINDHCYESLLFHMSQIEALFIKRSMQISTHSRLTLTGGYQYDVRDFNGSPWGVD